MTAQPSPELDLEAFELWEHKASFGADLVESAPACDIVLRPWINRGGLAAGRIRRAIRGR